MDAIFIPPEDIAGVRDEKQAIERRVSELRVREGRLSEQMESTRTIRERIDETRNKLEQVRTSIKECQATLHHYQVLKEAFGNIPINIHERLKPRIQSEVSWLLNEVTQGKYPAVAIDEDYTIKISSNGIFYPIYRFSGGEKDLINLCLRVGISRVLVSLSREQGFAHLESLFLDETFSSLDGERRRNLLSSLRTLEHFFSQIVIITHVDDVKEMMPFAYEIEEGPDGQSAVNLLKQSL
jgi:exonuclease SbcC